MAKFETLELNLPSAWACAIMYGDYSAHDEDEIAQINTALALNEVSFSDCLSIDEGPGFLRYHDGGDAVGAAECSIYTFRK